MSAISTVFLYSRLSLFSTYSSISLYLHFMGVGIIQFVDLHGSFSSLVSLHLSDAQVEVMVVARSA